MLSERIIVVEYIAFKDVPLKAKEATEIKVRLKRMDGSIHVKPLSYDDIMRTEGGREALEELRHIGIE
jgi:hypothetical protein